MLTLFANGGVTIHEQTMVKCSKFHSIYQLFKLLSTLHTSSSLHASPVLLKWCMAPWETDKRDSFEILVFRLFFIFWNFFFSKYVIFVLLTGYLTMISVCWYEYVLWTRLFVLPWSHSARSSACPACAEHQAWMF